MPDAAFDDPRLARLYDVLEGDRVDLDLYLEIAEQMEALTVLDIGCGTGVLARRLAELGVFATGVDPATASLDVARSKSPGSPDWPLFWVEGDVHALRRLRFHLAVMTGNVAQVFVDDDEWAATLKRVRRALWEGGYLVFETRIPEARAWERWTREALEQSLTKAGFEVIDVVDAPDRPGLEWVFIARRPE